MEGGKTIDVNNDVSFICCVGRPAITWMHGGWWTYYGERIEKAPPTVTLPLPLEKGQFSGSGPSFGNIGRIETFDSVLGTVSMR